MTGKKAGWVLISLSAAPLACRLCLTEYIVPCFFFFPLQTVVKQLSCHVEEVSRVQHMCLPNIFLTRCPKFVRLLLGFSVGFFPSSLKLQQKWGALPALLSQPSSHPSRRHLKIGGGCCCMSSELTTLTSTFFDEGDNQIYWNSGRYMLEVKTNKQNPLACFYNKEARKD